MEPIRTDLSATLHCDHLVLHQPESECARHLIVIEMAQHRVLCHQFQFFPRISLG